MHHTAMQFRIYFVWAVTIFDQPVRHPQGGGCLPLFGYFLAEDADNCGYYKPGLVFRYYLTRECVRNWYIISKGIQN